MKAKFFLTISLILSLSSICFAAELTEDQRKSVYTDFYAKFVTVLPESARLYPTDATTTRGWSGDEIMAQARKQYDYQNERFAQYEKETLEKYDITKEQLTAIRSEGTQKDW